MITVYNLSTDQEHIYAHDDPRAAVQMSNAIDHNDAINYTSYPIIEGEKTIASGDWAAYKDPRHENLLSEQLRLKMDYAPHEGKRVNVFPDTILEG